MRHSGSPHFPGMVPPLECIDKIFYEAPVPRTDEIAGLARTGCSTAPYPNRARRCSSRKVTECDYWPGGIEPEGGAGIVPMKIVRAVTVLPDLTPMMCTCSPAFRVGRLLDVLPLTRYRVVEMSLAVSSHTVRRYHDGPMYPR